MPYDITLVQFDGSLGGMQSTVAYFGFPSTPFNYFLHSYWMCIPFAGGVAGTIGPASNWFSGGPGGGINFHVQLTNNVTGVKFFDGTFGADVRGLRSHCIFSVNCATQVAQMYVNDQACPLLSGGFTAATQFHFSSGAGFDAFKYDIGSIGGYPACADTWCANTPAFVDLTVTANRRKFINADLSPVYLGANGSAPFGYQPPIYLTVPTAGVANDFLHNYGTGGAMALQGVGPSSISLQASGICTLPPPPPPPPPTGSLAMDSVVAIDQTPERIAGTQIFLEWSDDRGHSYGSPVGQPIGATGAYLTSIQWQRIGYARDRVFRLTWSVPVATALQGAFIEIDSRAKS